MGSFSDTPSLLSGGNIEPNRFVKPSTTADDYGLQAAASTTPVLGVSDMSTRKFDSAYHAIAEDPITLQGGDIVYVTAAGVIASGAYVESDANGKAVTATTTSGSRYHGYVALQAATAGSLCKIQRVSGMHYYP